MEETISQKNEFDFESFYKKNQLFLNCLMLGMLFLVNCFVPAFSYVAFTYLLGLIAFSNLKNGASYIFFCLPFGGLNLPYGAIFYLTCIFIYFIKLIVVKRADEGHEHKISIRTIVLVSCLAIYVLLPINNFYNIHLIIKLFCIFVVLFFIFLLVKFADELRVLFNLRVLAIAMVVSSLFYLFRPLSAHLQDTIVIFSLYKNLIRFSGLFYNPNIFALICDIAISVVAYYILSGKAKKYDVLTFVVFGVLGIVTFSKTFLIVLGIVLLFLLLHAIIYKSKLSAMCCLAMVVIGAIIVVAVPDFLGVYFGRFNLDGVGQGGQNPDAGEVMNGVTTGRFGIWKEYIKYILEHTLILIFGRGLGAPTLGIYSSHNLYIGAVYQLGIVGCFLLLFALISILYDSFKGENRKPTKAIFATLAVICLIACIEDLIFYIA